MVCLREHGAKISIRKEERMGGERFYYSERFKGIAHDQKVLLNSGMCEHGITYVQSLVLLRLDFLRSSHGEEYEITQKDVERYLSLRASTVTHILTRMEENGLIRRTKSSRDSRANRILLTEKGEACLPLFFDVLDGVERQMTEGMTEEERLLLRRLLDRVRDNLERQKEMKKGDFYEQK